MDDDEGVLGFAINLTVGIVVLAFEIGFWFVGVAIMIVVGLFEIFFDVLGLGDDS